MGRGCDKHPRIRPKGLKYKPYIQDDLNFHPIVKTLTNLDFSRWSNKNEVLARYREIWREILHNFGMDKCFKCGENRFYVIDYHHTNMSKRKDLYESAAQIFMRKPTSQRVEDFKESILSGKVKPLCSNCHREEHFLNGRRGREKL